MIAASYPWSDATDDAVHLQMLGRMAAINREVHGEDMESRAKRCGLTANQLGMLEKGLIVAPNTITVVLAACGYHRASFSRRHLEPALACAGDCAAINSREARRATLHKQVTA